MRECKENEGYSFVQNTAVSISLDPTAERSSLLSGASNPVHDLCTVYMGLIDLVMRSRTGTSGDEHDRTNSSCKHDAGRGSGPTGDDQAIAVRI